jgi:alpha-1,2-mannosyltransferase
MGPITWTHHIYWFIPAVVLLVDAGLRAEPGTARRRLLALAVGTYLVITYGVVSFQDWGIAPDRTDDPFEFVVRNAYVLLSLLLLAALPVRERDVTAPSER